MTDREKAYILVVDDMPDKLLVYQSVLEELDECIITARSGPEALREILARDFAVVLLDVNMPGMDGFETALMIRQRRRSVHLPLIFLTAYSDELRISQGYASGAVDYISTPVVPDVLRAKVRVFTDLFRLRKLVAQQAHDAARREAAELAAQRSAFLAESSRTLAESLDFLATRQRLSSMGVPFLSDACALCLTNSATQRDYSLSYANSSALPLTTFVDRMRPSPWLEEVVDRVSHTGKCEVLQFSSPAPVISESATSTEYSLNGWYTVAARPLTARGRGLGVILWGRSEKLRTFTADELSLADELAARGSIALDNSLLVRDIQDNDRRKNEFLAMLAHELRNPLAPIRNAHEILRKLRSDQPELSFARDVIERQVSYLVRLVDDLLDVSRITLGKIRLKYEVLDLSQVVANALETSRPLIDSREHTLDVSLPSHPILIAGDVSRLVQVFANLLNNAAKFTPNGGRISLDVTCHDREAVVRVRDDGAGIPQEMLAQVFELFTQVNHALDRPTGGLGVGLTLVRRIVELHRGSVQAMSEGLEMGSEFIVRLPIHVPGIMVETAETKIVDDAAPCAVHRVLLVDDNADAARTLPDLLPFIGTRSGSHTRDQTRFTFDHR